MIIYDFYNLVYQWRSVGCQRPGQGKYCAPLTRGPSAKMEKKNNIYLLYFFSLLKFCARGNWSGGPAHATPLLCTIAACIDKMFRGIDNYYIQFVPV